MTLVELKNYINNNILPSDFMIFVSKDSSFLVKQYIAALAKLAPNGINKISSIYEPKYSSLALLTQTDVLNVLTVETFDERAEDYSQFEHTIVVCDQVEKSLLKNVEQFIIAFPKLEDWQIFDYIKTVCSGLDAEEINWLIKATGGNMERITNELDKITIFDKQAQKEIFSAIAFDTQTDLYTLDLYTIANALIDGNNMVLYEFISHNDYESLDPVAIANRAFAGLKNIILVSQNPSLTAEDLGMSVNQHRFLKRNYSFINIVAAKEKLKFLVSFDLDLKTSKLDMSKRDMFSYLISHLAYKITT